MPDLGYCETVQAAIGSFALVQGRGSRRGMCSCKPAGRWLPVLFVFGLIGWCYFVYINDIILPMLGDTVDPSQHSLGVGYCITFNILLGLALLSMFRAVSTEPGRIPDSWIVGAEDSEVGAFLPQLQARRPTAKLGAHSPAQDFPCPPLPPAPTTTPIQPSSISPATTHPPTNPPTH